MVTIEDLKSAYFSEQLAKSADQRRRPELEMLVDVSYGRMCDALSIPRKQIPSYIVCERPLLVSGLLMSNDNYSDFRRYLIVINNEEPNASALNALHEAGHIFTFAVCDDLNEKLRKKSSLREEILQASERFAEDYAIVSMRSLAIPISARSVSKGSRESIDMPLENVYASMFGLLEKIQQAAAKHI